MDEGDVVRVVLTHDVDWPIQGPGRDHVLARRDRFDEDVVRRVIEEGYNPYYNVPDLMEIEERHGLRSTFFFRPVYDDGRCSGGRGRAYIATMQSSEPVRAFLERHGLAALVREVVGREMFGRKEDQIKYIIGREAGARRFIFVDDSRAHVENCRRLGLNVTCVLLRRSAGEGLADAIRGLRRFSEQRPIVDWEARAPTGSSGPGPLFKNGGPSPARSGTRLLKF